MASCMFSKRIWGSMHFGSQTYEYCFTYEMVVKILRSIIYQSLEIYHSFSTNTMIIQAQHFLHFGKQLYILKTQANAVLHTNQGVSLATQFPHLFQICNNQRVTLREVIITQREIVTFRRQFDFITLQEWSTILNRISSIFFTHAADSIAWK